MRKLFRSRRRVVVAVVAALAVVAVGSTTASAAVSGSSGNWHGPLSQCRDILDETQRILCETVVNGALDAKSPDYSPKDMKVGAPSSVISASAGSNSTPVQRAQAVGNWRRDTGTTLVAKERVAQAGGSAADVASVSRWKPLISKAAKGAGLVGGVLAGNELAWWLADDFLYPALGVTQQDKEDSFCMRYGNFVTDAIASLTRANCAEWRLNKDYEALVGTIRPVATGVAAGYTYVGSGTSGQGIVMHCYSGTGGNRPWFPAGETLSYVSSVTGTWTAPSNRGLESLSSTSYGTVCRSIAGATHIVTGQPDPFDPRLRYQRDGVTVEEMGLEQQTENAEWITRVRCLDGTTRTAVSDSFQQQALGAVAVPSAVALDGCRVLAVDVGFQKAGTGTAGAGGTWATTPGGTRTQVGTAEVPPAVQTWMQDYPACADGSCELDLRRVTSGSYEVSCFDSPDACADWVAESQSGTASYRCYYAGGLVDLAECNVYGTTFDRGKVQQGSGYADPSTGTGVESETGTAVKTNPGAALVAMAEPVDDPAADRECWPTGWGILNPFEWVYLPVKCALEWAFVPREAKLTQVQTQLKLASVNSPLGQVNDAVTAWGAMVPSSSECQGPHIVLSFPGNAQYSGYPFSACNDPMATVATITRAFLVVVFVLLGLLAISRYAARVFGYGGVGGGGSD